jgi:catalase
MSDEKNRTRHPPLSPSTVAGRLAVIGGLLFTSALAFAYAGGWLTPDRLTPTRMVAALSDRGGNPLGHRRNHSKGICFTGVFQANGRLHSIQSRPCWSRAVIPLSAGSP